MRLPRIFFSILLYILLASIFMITVAPLFRPSDYLNNQQWMSIGMIIITIIMGILILTSQNQESWMRKTIFFVSIFVIGSVLRVMFSNESHLFNSGLLILVNAGALIVATWIHLYYDQLHDKNQYLSLPYAKIALGSFVVLLVSAGVIAVSMIL